MTDNFDILRILPMLVSSFFHFISIALVLIGSVLWLFRSKNRLTWILIGSGIFSIMLLFLDAVWIFQIYRGGYSIEVLQYIPMVKGTLSFFNSLVFGFAFIALVLTSTKKEQAHKLNL